MRYVGERIFVKFSLKKIETILDIGCGPGLHATILSERSYQLTGIDISKVMIRKAKETAKNRNSKVCFFCQDMRNVSLNKKFNCAIMFEAFGHLLTQEDLNSTLSSLRQNLNDGGLFIFDFWNAHGATKLARAFSKAHRIRFYTVDAVRRHLHDNQFSLFAVYDWTAENKTKLSGAKKNTFQILAVANRKV